MAPVNMPIMDAVINRPFISRASPEVQCSLLKLSFCFRVFLCLYLFGSAMADSILTALLLGSLKSYFDEHGGDDDGDGCQTIAWALVFLILFFLIPCALCVDLSMRTGRDIRKFKHTQSRIMGLLPPPMPNEPLPESPSENLSIRPYMPCFSILEHVSGHTLIIILLGVGIVYSIGTMTLLTSAQWATSFDYLYSKSHHEDLYIAELSRESRGIFWFTLTMLFSPVLLPVIWLVFYLPLAYYIVKCFQWKKEAERLLYEERVLAAEAWCRMRDLSHIDDVQRWEQSRDPLPPYSETPPTTAGLEDGVWRVRVVDGRA